MSEKMIPETAQLINQVGIMPETNRVLADEERWLLASMKRWAENRVKPGSPEWDRNESLRRQAEANARKQI